MNRSAFARLSAGGTFALAGVASPYIARSAADLLPLRVGTLPLDGSAEPVYASELGYFEEAGLDVQLTISAVGGSALLAAVIAKQLDICVGSTAPLILARARGVKVRYFSPGSIYVGPTPNSALMVAIDSPIKTVADIKGKTIAVAAVHDLTQYCVQAWIKAGGGDPNDVKYVEIPYSAMVPAMQQGRVDAICQSEPFVTEAKSAARVLASLDDQIGKRYYLSGWLTTDEWPAQNVEVGKRFVNAMQKTARWANTHRAESAAILVKHSKIDPAIVAVMKRNLFDEGSRCDPRLMQDPLNMMIRYGGISPSITVRDLIWTG